MKIVRQNYVGKMKSLPNSLIILQCFVHQNVCDCLGHDFQYAALSPSWVFLKLWTAGSPQAIPLLRILNPPPPLWLIIGNALGRGQRRILEKSLNPGEKGTSLACQICQQKLVEIGWTRGADLAWRFPIPKSESKAPRSPHAYSTHKRLRKTAMPNRCNLWMQPAQRE